MIVLAWLIVLGLGTLLADGWLERRDDARAPRGLVAAGAAVGLELRADRSGHYYVDGRVDGEPVRFLVDTGASAVAIPETLARRLGLARGRPERVATANGPARVWRTTLDSVSLGPLEREGVSAYITPGMSGETALLGMSFLRHYELLQRDGRLVIRDPARA